ncbi:hypothetical protein NE237_007444 [Protea cynaroides]|uniref:Uncharacterized protein n=1 Tax=Protea cynaroides TaxID=273540 RepID=A0A9Q0KPH5_9MAGN|nr:hypothetical protein NE237_007444 [Protea cynaroides]
MPFPHSSIFTALLSSIFTAFCSKNLQHSPVRKIYPKNSSTVPRSTYADTERQETLNRRLQSLKNLVPSYSHRWLSIFGDWIPTINPKPSLVVPPGLMDAITELFPNAFHENCCGHLYANFKLKFLGL